MKPGTASLVNATLLIVLGLWGYLGSGSPSATAFIPVGFGVAIALCNPGLRRENKAIAHIAVLLTFLITLGLVMPLRGAIARSDTAALARVVVMLLSSIVALVSFIQSFRAARAARNSG